jgi:hypothetical protein
MQSLWSLAAWGLAAAIALALAAFASCSETGSRRFMLALGISQPAQKDTVTDIAPLVEMMRALAAERESLAARIGNIERKLDDLTGSISARPQASIEAVAAPTLASTQQTTPPAASQQPLPDAMAGAADRIPSAGAAKADAHKPTRRKRLFKQVRRTSRPFALFR